MVTVRAFSIRAGFKSVFKSKLYSALLLPRALLVAVGLQALFALVLVHLEAAFLFEVTHVVSGLEVKGSSRNRS